MISLTERYLAAALRSIPDAQRADVDRELRSSIADAVEDRVAAGEERASAEKAVLEGLGEPTRLASGYTGRPLYVIGPDVFLVYRHILATLVGVIVPIVAVVLTTVALAGGAGYLDGLMAGIGGAFSTGVHLAFWVTLTFVSWSAPKWLAGRARRWSQPPADGPWTGYRVGPPAASAWARRWGRC